MPDDVSSSGFLYPQKEESILNTEKRMAGDYEVIHAIHIGDREIVIGDNPKAPPNERFMCALGERNDFFCRFDNVLTSDDYAEIMSIFGVRITAQAEKTRQELSAPIIEGIDVTPICKEDCIPISRADDINNKIVVIKPDVFRREYQRSTNQLKLCTGGFGASPNSRGSACFCMDLYTGKTSRFERSDVMGILEQDQLPEWAQHHLELHLNQRTHIDHRKEASL